MVRSSGRVSLGRELPPPGADFPGAPARRTANRCHRWARERDKGAGRGAGRGGAGRPGGGRQTDKTVNYARAAKGEKPIKDSASDARRDAARDQLRFTGRYASCKCIAQSARRIDSTASLRRFAEGFRRGPPGTVERREKKTRLYGAQNTRRLGREAASLKESRVHPL